MYKKIVSAVSSIITSAILALNCTAYHTEQTASAFDLGGLIEDTLSKSKTIVLSRGNIVNFAVKDAKVTCDLRKSQKNSTCIITVTSGACVTVAIPDDNGNIDFYVEKENREFDAEIQVVCKVKNSNARQYSNIESNDHTSS